MLLASLASVALYCQRCGRIEIVDVPVFTGANDFAITCSHCGEVQARARISRRGLALRTRCVVCGKESEAHFSLHQLRAMRFEKVYCPRDHFELGYLGRWQEIAEFLDFNAAEYDALHPHDAYNFMERQQILLEAFNRVHDLAAAGELFCPCGGHDFTADIAEDAIFLECAHCGSSAIIPARDADDLKQLQPGFEAVFLQPDLMGNR